MKTLYIFQGIPGSGKSTLAQIIAAAIDATILSTDEFWYNERGKYCYEEDKAGAAHKWNQRRCIDEMLLGTENIIIDNTNIKQKEAQPYLSLGEMFGYTIQVIRIEASEEVCRERQNQRSLDRKIPGDVIRRKFRDLERIEL